jgi:hypothetical protein
MKPALLIAVAIVAVLGVAAIALAATSGGDDDSTAQASATPANTATSEPTAAPSATPTSQPATPTATVPPADTATPEPSPEPATPIPSEPPFTVTPAPPSTSLPAGRHAEPAPIDELDVRVAESFPPQYFLYLLAGLPSGCAEQYIHSVARSGNEVEVEVLNSIPDGTPLCTAIYGQYELNINMGSDFVSGQEYTVSVNGGDAEFVFTAQ